MPSLLDKLFDIPLAFVDVETTGASTDYGDRVIEIGIVRIERGQRVAEYQQLKSARRLSARMMLSHAVNGGGRLETVQEDIRRVAQHPLRKEDPWLRIVGIKTYLDGGMLAVKINARLWCRR